MPIPHIRRRRSVSAMDAMTTTSTLGFGLDFLFRIARNRSRLSMPSRLPSINAMSAGNFRE